MRTCCWRHLITQKWFPVNSNVRGCDVSWATAALALPAQIQDKVSAHKPQLCGLVSAKSSLIAGLIGGAGWSEDALLEITHPPPSCMIQVHFREPTGVRKVGKTDTRIRFPQRNIIVMRIITMIIIIIMLIIILIIIINFIYLILFIFRTELQLKVQTFQTGKTRTESQLWHSKWKKNNKIFIYIYVNINTFVMEDFWILLQMRSWLDIFTSVIKPFVAASLNWTGELNDVVSISHILTLLCVKYTFVTFVKKNHIQVVNLHVFQIYVYKNCVCDKFW